MAVRKITICLFLAAALCAAYAAETEVGQRQFIGSDLTGEFELFVKQGKCPNKIVHKDYKAGPQGTYIVPHKKIAQNGVDCTGEGVLGVVSKETLENLGGLDTLLQKKDIAPIVNELKKQGSTFLVGLENAQRTCGDSTIGANSIFLFVEEEKEIEVPGLINLFPGAKYMIIYEPNSPVPCTYFSKSSDRAIGAPISSPKPINAKPAPPGAVPPGTGSQDNDSQSDDSNGGLSGQGSDNTKDNIAGSEGDSDSFGTDSGGAFDGAGRTEEPQESTESDGGSTCFPSDASVTLPGGFTKRMDAIQLGDHVQVAPGLYSEVFMFTHRDTDSNANFVDITTASGAKLQLTPGHYMYVNSRLAAASTVRQGDIVDLANGEASTVVGVHAVTKTGIYNPQTVHGDIVVNGIVASTFTRTVHPNAAHSFLAPFRALFRAFGVSTAVFDSGSETLATVSPKGTMVF